jgi:hypothetical protein
MRRRARPVKVLAELRQTLAGFPLELRLIDHAEQTEGSGHEFGKAAQIATIVGARVEDVYRALARIRRYKESVYAAVDGQVEESE